MANEQTTIDIHERLARLEKGAETTDEKLGQISIDVRTIRDTLNQISGGKRAGFAIYAGLGAVVTIAVNLLTGWWSSKAH